MVVGLADHSRRSRLIDASLVPASANNLATRAATSGKRRGWKTLGLDGRG